jgi:calpain-7
MLDAWKRPSDALPPPFWSSSSSSERAVADLQNFMKGQEGIDLVQDAATDCSVVASLTAAHARRDRGFEKVSCLKTAESILANISSFYLAQYIPTI